MNSVDVKRVPEGYVVSCVVRNLPAAMRAVDELLKIEEAGFEVFGVLPEVSQAVRTCSPAYDAHPGVPAGVIDVTLRNPVRQDTGD